MALEDPKTTRTDIDAAVWGACDVLRRSNCAGALQYVPELSWLLFLRVLDLTEEREAAEAAAFEESFGYSLEAPYRWRDWAAPGGPKREELQSGALNAFRGFVDNELYCRALSGTHVGGSPSADIVIRRCEQKEAWDGGGAWCS